jgi:hypothetical protein
MSHKARLSAPYGGLPTSTIEQVSISRRAKRILRKGQAAHSDGHSQQFVSHRNHLSALYRKRPSVLKNPFVPSSEPRWGPEKPDFVVFAGYFGIVLRPRPAQNTDFFNRLDRFWNRAAPCSSWLQNVHSAANELSYALRCTSSRFTLRFLWCCWSYRGRL